MGRWVQVFALVFVVAASAVWAQTGQIQGRVTDVEGDPLPGAVVIVEGTALGAVTDPNGAYTIRHVPPGTYTLRVELHGFRSQTATVTVEADRTVRQDFALVADIIGATEIVVTGTYLPRRKIESTVAISTLAPPEIRLTAPRSTTEVLRRVPGFTRVESSGGEVNQNISVRGLLGVESVLFMEDGMPVYPTMHTFFMNADNLFRPDENIEEIEVVRGGNTPLFGSSTTGAIVNFINKVGGPELQGVLKATVGTDGLGRVDFNLNGPLTEDWRFNVGGFYRYDRGVRYPGYPGIRGGQFKANVTRLLENGYVRFYIKYINDRNQFILPLPFQNPDDPSYVPGFSKNGAMSTNEGNHVKVPLPTGEQLELPLDDGIRTRGFWLTAETSFHLGGGWELLNIARVMSADHAWNAIVPFDVLFADDWARGVLQDLISRGIVPPNATYQLLFTNVRDAAGNRVPFNTPNGLISPGGEWHVEKPISDFSNLFRIHKAFANHSLTFGLYFAYYTQKNLWYFTEILTDVRDNPHFVDMVVTWPGGQLDVTKNGFRRFLSLYVNGNGHTTLLAGFAGDEIRIGDRLRIDLGFRVEHANYVQVVENPTTVDLDGNPNTLYNNVAWGDMTFRQFEFGITDWAASAGINYTIVPGELAIYAQATRGYWMPALDEFLFAQEQRQVELFEPRHTVMVDLGIKYSGRTVGFTVTGFYGRLFNVTGQGAEVDPDTGEITWVQRKFPSTRGGGTEIELLVQPIHGLELRGAATLVQITAPAGAQAPTFYKGLTPAVIDVSATYTYQGFTFLVDWHYVGRRFSNPEKTIELKPYSYLNLGASYRFPGVPVTVSAKVLNVFNSFGFEEGNPRLDPTRGAAAFLFLARPILPRRAILEVLYEF